MKKLFSFTPVSIAIAALFCTVSMVSCESDLLGTPPSAVSITLLSEPVVTPKDDSAVLLCNTSQNSTVTIDYGTVQGTYDFTSVRTTVESTDHTVSLTNLTPLATYYYRVVSWFEGSRSFKSNEYQFQTAPNSTVLPTVLTTVLSIAADPTVTPGLTTLSIAFTTSDDCTSVVEYGTVAGTYTAATLQTTTASTSHNASLTGLSSGTTYYYRIKLYQDAGNDLVSSQYTTATTPEPAPTAAQKARGIWIIGGLNGATINLVDGTIDLYDPVTNTWYAEAVSITNGTGYMPVSFAAYAAYEGKLFVFGGFDSSGVVQNLTQIYTIATDTWSAGAVLPQARANIYASILNDRIYILGGTTANATSPWAAVYTPPVGDTSTAEYSIATDTWNPTKVAFGTAGSERFSYAYDGTIYNLGGRTSAPVVVLTHDGLLPFTVAQPLNGELDGAAATGTVEIAMTAVRGGFTGGVYKPATTPAFVYIIGGVAAYTGTTGCFVNQGASTPAPLNTVQYMHYPFAAPRTWGTGPNYPINIAHGASVVSTAFSTARIIHFGGVSTFGATSGTTVRRECYSIPTPPNAGTVWNDLWTTYSISNMPTARWGHGAVTLNQ